MSLNKSPLILNTNIKNVKILKLRPKGYLNLLKFFRFHIIEMVFIRRNEIKNKNVGHLKKSRRMLCTSSWEFLKHPTNQNLFKWKKPSIHRGYQFYKNKNLIIVWDFLKNDFRVVNLDHWKLISYLPLNTLENLNSFKMLFKESLSSTKLQKNKRDFFSDL